LILAKANVRACAFNARTLHSVAVVQFENAGRRIAFDFRLPHRLDQQIPMVL
jgi:hypothetical protein